MNHSATEPMRQGVREKTPARAGCAGGRDAVRLCCAAVLCGRGDRGYLTSERSTNRVPIASGITSQIRPDTPSVAQSCAGPDSYIRLSE